MTGKTTWRAATAGAFFCDPPIGKRKADDVLGCEMPACVWEEIKNAYAGHAERLNDLSASKLSRKKDDPRGWTARKTATMRALEDALKKLDAARSKHGDFLYEASENHSLQTRGHSGIHRARKLVDDAFMSTLNALIIVDRAEPIEIEVPTEATSREIFVRDVWDILRSAEIEVRASYGAKLDQLERVTLADLTNFERLIAEFQIGDEKKPAAFSAFVRGALAGGKRG